MTVRKEKVMEYKEIFKLKEMLEKEKIPFYFRNLYDGYQICYPRNDNLKEGIFDRVCSVIEHNGSYGHNNDLLEIKGLMTKREEKETQNSVLGYLSAKDVFKRIKKHWKRSSSERPNK